MWSICLKDIIGVMLLMGAEKWLIESNDSHIYSDITPRCEKEEGTDVLFI